jgi:DNA-binding transcriptional LysR family regulator
MPGTAYRQTALALTNTTGFTPAIAHEVLEWTAVASLVGHGLGIALLPRLARLPAQPTVVRTPVVRGAQPPAAHRDPPGPTAPTRPSPPSTALPLSDWSG